MSTLDEIANCDAKGSLPKSLLRRRFTAPAGHGVNEHRTNRGTVKRFSPLPALAAALMLAGCDDPKGAQDALSAAGYSAIHLTGYAFLSCGEKDQFSTGFVALGPTGVCVRGAVCSAWLKGSTVRIDGLSKTCPSPTTGAAS